MVTLLIVFFVVGYLLIAFEGVVKINKAAIALLTAVACWVAQALCTNPATASHHLAESLAETSGILFFLLGAMTIVELIDSHDGFFIISQQLLKIPKNKFVWAVALLSFFLSAVLDNLTTTIVIISILRKIIPHQKSRWLLAGLTIICANAGGVFSPIGDVTTTMLWMGQQITTAKIIATCFLPSLASIILPTLLISKKINLQIKQESSASSNFTTSAKQRNFVFGLGMALILFVPIFKTVTHLPPYLGMLFGLAIFWVVLEVIHSGKSDDEKGALSVNHALRKIDTPSILFFLGILLTVAALQHAGILAMAAQQLNILTTNVFIINFLIGLLSAIVDNVPIVAALQAMYSLNTYPQDDIFWQALAYCAGTGGSLLIIGSAAGVAAMGIEKIDFLWYLRKISWLAFLSFCTGLLVLWLLH
jgi:Na+/H+ antiporter NhaD/arsenite permease-like protein